MARPNIIGMTDYELSIVKILWERPSLSVSEILEEFPRKPKPAYTSLLTVIRTMEKKGYLTHTKQGKAYLYSTVVKKENYKSFEIKKMADRLFGGSKFDLAVNLIKEEKLGASEIKRLKSLLEDL